MAAEPDPYRQMGWNSAISATTRYELVKSRLIGDTLLDVGCGHGLLYEYLTKAGVTLRRYCGVESLSRFRLSASLRTGQQICCDLAEVEGEFDSVAVIGVLCTQHSLSDVEQLLTRCWTKSKRMMLVSAVHGLFPAYAPAGFLHIHPNDLLSIAMKLSRTVELRTGYLRNDVMVAIYRED